MANDTHNTFSEFINRNVGTHSLLVLLVKKLAADPEHPELTPAEARWARRVLALIKEHNVKIRTVLDEHEDEVEVITANMVELLSLRTNLSTEQDSWYRVASILGSLYASAPHVDVSQKANDYLSSLSDR